MIPHSRPVFGQGFSSVLSDVIESGQLVCGGRVSRLEQEIATRVGLKHAVAVDSGTSGLMLAIRAIVMQLPAQQTKRKIGIPAYACASLLHAVRAAGCEPVCMDCGDDLRLLPDEAIKQAQSLDAVIIVHPFGMIEPMVAEDWPCPVIEDIAQVAGGVFEGVWGAKAVGSFGDVTVASFHATKPWGGAYGGMVLSDDAGLCEAVSNMSNPDVTDLLEDYVGHHILSDVHAALVLQRLSVAEQEQAQRLAHAHEMDEWFAPLSASPVLNHHQGNHFRYIVRLDGAAEDVLSCLHAQGVGAARPVKTPLNRYVGRVCSGAEKAWEDCISLPLLSSLSDEEKQKMQKAVMICM